MLSAIDIPKSKSITITFTALKLSILSLLLTITFRQLSSQLSPSPSASASTSTSTDSNTTAGTTPYASSSSTTQCSDTLMQLSIILKLFFILSSSLDLCLLVYFLCTQGFKRMQYYILFGFHLILFMIVGIISLVELFKKDDCVIKDMFLGGNFTILLIFLILALLVMYCNLYFGLKFVHFGGSIVWTFLWLQSIGCGNVLLAFIGIVHGVLSIFGFVIFVILNIIKKSSTTAKCWRHLYILSIALLLLVYIISFISEASVSTCPQGKLLTHTYQKYGLIEIISPILLLIFLNTQMGDPRDAILKQEIKGVLKGVHRLSATGIQIDETN